MVIYGIKTQDVLRIGFYGRKRRSDAQTSSLQIVYYILDRELPGFL